MSQQRCLIIGASHAAAQLAPSLRQEGWGGSITVIGEESYQPYNRPPLSKTFLAGEKTAEQLLIRSPAAYDKFDIEFKLGVKVSRIDRERKLVELATGEQLEYDKLALTMGSRVRKADLPGMELAGIFYLKSIDDVEQIRPFVSAGRTAVVVGGGYVGLETAAMLKKIGMEVTVLETAERLLSRVTAPQVSEFFTRIHDEEGVVVKTGVTVSGFAGSTKVEQVICSDGQTFAADLVVMGIGILPNVELAAVAGIEVENGIVVDAHCATSDEDIVAAGDCTQYYSAFYQRNIRLESVQNAVDQAKVAAATICNKVKEYTALPWFWSDQFDLKLQIAGLSAGYDELIIRGDIKVGRKFSIFYFQQGTVIAVDAVNSPQEFMLGKRIITEKIMVDKDKLADQSVAMKTLLMS